MIRGIRYSLLLKILGEHSEILSTGNEHLANIFCDLGCNCVTVGERNYKYNGGN